MKQILRKDLRHALLIGASTTGNAFFAFIGGVILIRAMPTEEYGLISAAMALLLVSQEFVGRGINDGMVRLGTDAVAQTPERCIDVFRAGLFLKLFFGLLLVLFLLVYPYPTAQLFGFSRLNEAFPAVAAAIAGFGLWSFILSWHQAKMAFVRLALLQPFCNVIKVCLYGSVILFSTLHWVQAIWIMAIAFFFGACVAGSDVWSKLAFSAFDIERFKKALSDLWKCSSWNLIAAVSFVMLSRIDIFILTHHVTASEVGVYNAAWQMLIIIDLGTISLMTVMIPKVAHYTYRDEIVEATRRIFFLGAVACVLSLPLFLFPNWYVPLFLGEQYLQSVPLLRIMYWGNILGLLVFPLIGVLYARNAFYLNAVIQVFLLALSYVLYSSAVQQAGIVGAAWINFALKAANAGLIAAIVIVLIKKAPRKKMTEEKINKEKNQPLRG